MIRRATCISTWRRTAVLVATLLMMTTVAVLLGPLPAQARGQSDARERIALPELVRLGDLFLASGRTGRAIEFYNRFRWNFQDEPLYWRRFAALYEHSGDLERALSCLEHVAHLEGTVLADVVKESELLWRLQRPDAALARLVGSKEQADPGEVAYWELLYQLAWEEEQELLALEALRMRWQARPDPESARNLCHLLAETGGYDEAARVALASLQSPAHLPGGHDHQPQSPKPLDEQPLQVEPQPALLLLGTQLALEGERLEQARALVMFASRHSDRYRKHPEYFLARALVAVAGERAGEADQEFQHALAMKPDLDGGCPAWFDASVSLEDRVMAEHALGRCEDQAQRRPAAWDLLADVYNLVGRPAEAARWRKLARSRSTWGEPLGAARGASAVEMTLIEAVERDDHPAVAALLAADRGRLSLSARVAGLQAVDRSDEAWALLEDAGLTRPQRLPTTPVEAALMKKARRMRGDRLSGAWARGEARAIGALRVEAARAWTELRLSPLYLGVEAEGSRLHGPETLPVWPRAREAQLALSGRMRDSSREIRLTLGGRFLPGLRPLPHGRLSYHGSTMDRRFRLSLQAFLAELPTYTALLRTSAIQDGGSFGATWLLAHDIEAGGLLQANFFSTRERQTLGSELELGLEAARRFDLDSFIVRPRVFATRAFRRSRARLPSSVLPFVLTDEDSRQLQLADFASLGLGLGLGNDLGQEALARGPHPSLRYNVTAFAAYVWPYVRPGFGAEGNLGFIFARHQELAAAAFFYSGWREGLGQSYAGISLTYAVRWN